MSIVQDVIANWLHDQIANDVMELQVASANVGSNVTAYAHELAGLLNGPELERAAYQRIVETGPRWENTEDTHQRIAAKAGIDPRPATTAEVVQLRTIIEAALALIDAGHDAESARSVLHLASDLHG